ncbi:unnamed protein product, partial [Effrenium voratum]
KMPRTVKLRFFLGRFLARAAGPSPRLRIFHGRLTTSAPARGFAQPQGTQTRAFAGRVRAGRGSERRAAGAMGAEGGLRCAGAAGGQAGGGTAIPGGLGAEAPGAPGGQEGGGPGPRQGLRRGAAPGDRRRLPGGFPACPRAGSQGRKGQGEAGGGGGEKAAGATEG